APTSLSSVSAHADQAVGAVQTSPGVHPSMGGMPYGVDSRARLRSVRLTAPPRAGLGKTVMAQAADESSSPSPRSRTRPRTVRKRLSTSPGDAPEAIALRSRAP